MLFGARKEGTLQKMTIVRKNEAKQKNIFKIVFANSVVGRCDVAVTVKTNTWKIRGAFSSEQEIFNVFHQNILPQFYLVFLEQFTLA